MKRVNGLRIFFLGGNCVLIVCIKRKKMIFKREMKFAYYFLFWCVVIITLLALMVLISDSVKAETIEPGLCYYRNISVGVNETFEELINVCSSNCTFENESVTFNITLFPGQDQYMKESNCEADFTCELGESTSAKCIYTKNLDPGDSVNILTDNCDLDIEVDDCNGEQCETELPTTYKEEYSIDYNGFEDEIVIRFAGKKYRYSLGNESSFDITNTITYTCPTVFDDEELDSGDLIQQCKAIIPTYCTELSGILMKRFDSCEGRKSAVEDDLKNCQAKVSNSVCVESKFYAEMVADGKITKNESVKCIFNEGKLSREIENQKTWSQELGFFIIILMGLNAWQFFKPKLPKKESVVV